MDAPEPCVWRAYSEGRVDRVLSGGEDEGGGSEEEEEEEKDGNVIFNEYPSLESGEKKCGSFGKECWQRRENTI